MEEKKRIEARKYQKAKIAIALGSLIASLSWLFIFLLTGLSANVRDITFDLIFNRYLALLVHTTIWGGVLAILAFLFSLYSGYFLEHRYSLSNQSLAAWLREHLKSLGVGVSVLIPMLVVFYFFLSTLGQHWWIPTGAMVSVFSIVLSKLFPILLIPIFYKLTPIQDSMLKERLSTLASSLGLRVTDVFSFDLSKNSKKACAALVGLGSTRRVILADTLMERFDPDEIEVVFAHELGHQQYGHPWKVMLLNLTTTFVGLYLASKLVSLALGVFGLEGMDDIAAVPLIFLILFAFGLVVAPAQNAFSRHLEREADGYAVRAVGTIVPFFSALEKLASMNLSDPNPHPIVEFLLYDHPSIEKRIRWAEEEISKSAKDR